MAVTLQTSTNFSSLSCTKEQEGSVKELFNHLSQGALHSVWYYCEIQEVGKKLKSMHPLKFLTVIVLDLETKKNCKEALDTTFIGSQVLENFDQMMKDEDKKSNLASYFPGFIDAIKTVIKIDNSLITKKDWQGLFKQVVS